MGAGRILKSMMRRHGVEVRVYHKIRDFVDTDTGLTRSLYLFESVDGIKIPQSTARERDTATGNFISLKTTEFIITEPQRPVDTTTVVKCESEQFEIVDHDTSDGVVWIIAQKQEEVTDILEDDMAIGPDVGYGESAGETIAVNHLVFQNGEDIYKASQDDTGKPALGIVTDIIGDTIYHSRHISIDDLTVLGTPLSSARTIYLGVSGLCTFSVPLSGIKQEVGFAQTQNADDTWVVVIAIDSNIVSL